MKIISLLALTIIFILGTFIISEKVLAHPGRTNKSGYHTCYTNCAKWGLKYGQYHTHYSYKKK